jgi:hypothetical protein
MLIVSGCDGDDLSLTIEPPALTTDEMIIADCYAVRDAMEAYAAANGGEFFSPSSPRSGFTAFLPGRTDLPNRYTGRATVPVFNAPYWPGEIGVIVFTDENFDQVGYRIVGRGRHGELIRLENVSQMPQEMVDGYDLVIANVDTLMIAVDLFFERSGYYAHDTADDLPSGETLIDLLPGGRFFINPFSGCPCEPQDGRGLGNPGGIGYTGCDDDGDGRMDCFVIEAYGHDYNIFLVRTRQSLEDDWVRHSSFRLKYAVEEFADDNGGVFPRDLDADQTPAGDTLRDLISDDNLNPYTSASAYRNGLATSRGEVGYQALEYNGVAVGYVINALGLFEEELERYEVLP